MKKIIKLKYLVSIPITTGTGAEAKEYNQGDLRYIRISDFDKDGNILEEKRVSIPYKDGKKYILKNGDILAAVTGGTVGKSILFNYNEECAYAGYLARIRTNEKKLYNRFLLYYMMSTCFEDFKNTNMTKSTMENLSASKYANMPVIIYSIDKQHKIADFLDKKVKEIDIVINKTKETIEDYKKIKYCIIYNKITKGLNKNVELKETENIHIKEIPNNWVAKKIKYIFEIKKEIAGKEGYDILSITQNGIKIKDLSKNEGQLSSDYSKYQLVNKGDFAMNHMDLLTGWVDISKYNGVTSPDYRVFKFLNKEENDPQYYLYLMQMCYMGKIFYDLGQGVSNLGRWRLQTDIFLNFVVPNPPLKEQREISNYLLKKCKEIDNLINYKEKNIEELEKYKKSLIYEYVTGKKKVGEKRVKNTDNINEIKINCKDNIFAQAILLCKIIEKLKNYNLGRVKAEKVLYLIEQDVGFEFNNKYVREAAGPLSDNIYKCESIISKNKWVNIKKVKKYIEYEILPNFNKYSKYYDKYFSNYDSQIGKIIDIVKNYSTDKAEMVATLYASWNDFIIKKDKVSEIEIVRDVRENWNDRKKRFNEREWLEVLEEMKQNGLTPKGNGNLTVIKE